MSFQLRLCQLEILVIKRIMMMMMMMMSALDLLGVESDLLDNNII